MYIHVLCLTMFNLHGLSIRLSFAEHKWSHEVHTEPVEISHVAWANLESGWTWLEENRT